MEVLRALRRYSLMALLTSLLFWSFNAGGVFADVIVDNGGIGTSFTGTWLVSGGSQPYGLDSLWSRDGATYMWRFESQPAGMYEVLMWWSGYSSRATSVAVDISYYGGRQNVSINQHENAGRWNSLGTYYFNSSGSVTITAASGASVSTCADAVWFRLVSQNAPPTAYIDSISPNPAEMGQAIEFAGYGTDAEGSIKAYQWESNINGVISNSGAFSTSALAEGVHTISFRVQDNENVWSQPATQVLVVGNESAEVIIDNRDAGTSRTGTWQVSGAPGPYGADSLWSRDGATFTWRFTVPQSGNYRVSMWWTEWSSRSTNIPVDIQYAGGTARVYINQRQNGGQWNSLGEYSFEAGRSYGVTITAQPNPSSTCADAVRFEYVAAANIPPTAAIDSIKPNPAKTGEKITFSGHGTDSDGTVVNYEWRSSVDGYLSNLASFSSSTLSAGAHTIFFRVQDDEGAWSAEVSESLSVGAEAEEHIYIALIYNWENLKPQYISVLQSLGAYQQGSVWIYKNAAQQKTYTIHWVESIDALKQALKTPSAHIICAGHSNYGLGPVFATSTEISKQVINDVRYIDDDRIFNVSTPWVHVDTRYLRASQAYPYWWSIFKDGTSGIMPYDFGDPRGEPAYNYYLTYQVSGDPNYYKVETVRNGALERFFDSGRRVWYSADGSEPDSNDPNHLKYFITNTQPWFPSFESVGNWAVSKSTAGYYKENYLYTQAGQGNKKARYLFTIPKAGNYNVSAWWPATGTQTSAAPYTVNHGLGSTAVTVDQRINGGRWNSLGKFYFDANEYSVLLTDNAESGLVVADGVKVGDVNNPPEVVQSDFIAVPTYGPAPLNVTFINTGTGDLTSRVWNFGDGLTNNSRDFIAHQYTSPGTYTVSLTVSGPLGSNSRTKVNYITVGGTTPGLRAEFAAGIWGLIMGGADPRNASVPMVLDFTDISTGDLRKGITYRPSAGYSGTATFAYTVRDNMGQLSNEANVSVIVGDSPVARDDSAITSVGTAVVIGVLANDTDPNGTIMANTVEVTSGPNDGVVDVNTVDGTITYTPAPEFTGVDRFTYTVKDNTGALSNSAVVTVIVGNSPVANNDSAITKIGAPVSIGVVKNDVDSDGNIIPSTVVITDGPNNGSVDVNAVDGTVTYSPEPAFAGTDRFTYQVEDDAGNLSNEATVTVIVSNLPVARDDAVITSVDKEVTINVLANDADSNGTIDPGTIVVMWYPSNGTVTVHDPWSWDFGDGQISHEQNPIHVYATPGIYTVSLTVTDARGNKATETKKNLVRAVVYEKNIDNVDYPKTHFRNKTIVFRKEIEIASQELKYSRMLYDSCNSGNYYIGTFHRGLMFYTVSNSGSRGSVLYLRACLEGKSDEQIWETVQAFEPSYDYYNFDKAPSLLQPAALSMLAMPNTNLSQATVDVAVSAENEKKIRELKNLAPGKVFERLKDADFWTDGALLHKAIFATFENKKKEAIDLAMGRLKLRPTEMVDGKVVRRTVDLYLAKKILGVFSDEAVGGLLKLYKDGDAVTRGNIIRIGGELADNAAMRSLLISAMEDKTSIEDKDPELTGEPLRICDLAYNQLVLKYKIKDVLRTIGTGHGIETRDYHINALKSRF